MESGEYRRYCAFSADSTMTALVSPRIRALMVASFESPLTAVTVPETPRRCHSSFSASCFLARSALLITSTEMAAPGFWSSLTRLRVRTRSPTPTSFNSILVTFVTSVSPGGMRWKTVFWSSTTVVEVPASVLIVNEDPSAAVTSPITRTDFAAASWARAAPAAIAVQSSTRVRPVSIVCINTPSLTI